jgi:hypothetical protein
MADPGDDTDDDLGFVVVGQVDEGGRLFTPFQDQRPEVGGGLTTVHFRGRSQDSPEENGQPRTVIWFGSLVCPLTQRDALSGRYTILRVTNLMAYFNLGNVSVNSMPDENSQDICRDFCISSWVILFTARDPELDEATHTAGSCYICSMLDWSGLIVPDDYYKAFRHRGLGGACFSPAVSRGGSVAFLAQKQHGYAADKNRVLIVTDNQKGTYKEIFASADGKGAVGYESLPCFIRCGRHAASLCGGARAEGVLSACPGQRGHPGESKAHRTRTYARKVRPRRHLIRCEAFKDPAHVREFVHGQQFILHDLASGSIREFPHDNPRFGLTDMQIDEIWFPSANGRRIYAWVIRPSFFNPEHKYPLAYFIHGDQDGSWSSSWNTTTGLNLALFAEHGYVVVAPNVLGSIWYGEDFVNATQYHFASAAYEDLEHGSRYLEKEVSYIDTRRSVALGCGYGGCMINWIQGHDLGRRFRALVSCNGIVSIVSYLSTDVQHAIFHELGGPPWDSPEEWRRSDPTQHLHNWSTPQLVIHDAAHMHFPVSDAVVAVKTLRLRGVECEFLELAADEGSMRGPQRLILFYRTILDWMGRLTMR